MTTTAEVGSEHRGQLEKLARRGSASIVGAGFSAVFGVLLVVVVTNGFSATLAGTTPSADRNSTGPPKSSSRRSG